MTRFGLLVSCTTHPDGDLRRATDRVIDRVARVGEAGFDSVWANQHLVAEPYSYLDTSCLIARIAAVTGQMEVQGMYALPLHHPLRLAEEIRTLQAFLPGGFGVVGFLGWRRQEFAAFGISTRQRVPRLTESVELLRLLLSGTGPVTYRGNHFEVTGAELNTSSPVVPSILLGASSLPAVRRAAGLGDGWLVSAHTPRQVLRVLKTEYDSAIGSTRPGRVALTRHCVVADTYEVARDAITQALGDYYQIHDRWGLFEQVLGPEWAERDPLTRAEDQALFGTPDDVVEQIARYRALGIDEFVLQVGLHGADDDVIASSIDLLAREVIPAVQAETATASSS